MTTYQETELEQPSGIPFDTSDFAMHSYSQSVSFGTAQNTTMDEWDDEGDELEEDSELEDEEVQEGDEEETLLEDEEDDEFEQYLFGEDDD